MPRGLQLFLMGFLMYVIAALPILIRHNGLFFYYGDYNVQQVPFYILAHRAVRSGHFLWNWNLDLGGSLIGDLSFYLMGSPFFWLTVPFPEHLLPYMMPYLMGLKYATATVTSYYYIRRYTKYSRTAQIGALLYAFSGFDACNVVFNHFTDVVAFFPLLMIAFDDLMQIDHHKAHEKFELCGFKWVRFTLTVTLIATINYYFFFGEALFLILYACVRYVKGNSFRTVRYMILRALTGGALGIGLVGFYLMMALGGVAGNTRLDNILLGYDLLVYPSAKMYFDIFKSMIMIPDIIGKGTLFYTATVKNASLAVYLPMFGLAGVIAYCIAHKKDWKRTLILICLVIAMMPFLNATFSLLNSQYYARWFYMPILIMAIMTVQMLERDDHGDMRTGALATIISFLLMVVIAILPAKNDDGKIVYNSMAENNLMFWHNVAVTAVISIALIMIIFLVQTRKKRIMLSYAATIVSCIACTMMMLINGSSLISDYGMKEWKMQMLDSKPSVDMGEQFGRTETDSTSTNYEMVWGIPTIHCFLSTVPSEIFNFYEGACGITRTVESDAPLERIGLRALLSTKYYMENSDINKDGEFSQGKGIIDYMQLGENSVQNGFTIYENMNYIPMGFTFDYYVPQSVWDTLNKADGDRSLVKAIILSDEDAAKYGSFMKELSQEDITSETMTNEDFADVCNARAQTACTKFETTADGFKATTSNLPKENLVFFSVPDMAGFTAKVDGVKTDIVTADYGLMAIDVPAGVHEITVSYLPQGFYLGMLISVISVMILLCYILIYLKKKKNVVVASPEESAEDKISQ
ncbi:MAG: YfhO family protein [Butyrivibrio sp.]|nr:YfhO family protein [Butyrivibrio sp.]